MLGHTIVAHHHHDFEIAQHNSHGHHDDGDDEDHNLFSFAQFDESYIHSTDKLNLNLDFVFVATVHQPFQFELINFDCYQKITKTIDDPPSDSPYKNGCVLRGPPVY